MFQLSTGGGKTFIFSHIAKMAADKGKRVLILVDREELIQQTTASLIKMETPSEGVTAKKRKLQHFANVYVGMVETAYNRLTKNPDFFRNIDLLIIDEAHMMSYNKIFPFFQNSKILGVTATPVILKRQTFYKCDICKTEYLENTMCCNTETMEWSKPFSLNSIYDTIVCGPNISELIEDEKLVKEISMVRKSVDTSKLKTDKTGDYTEKSQNHAFGASESIKALVSDYEKYCKGKKTMIFTGSTKVNALLQNAFEKYNAKIFDTVNSDDDRKAVVNWFRKEKDAILISTGIFTKGFDVKDVDVIILYRATKSLALYVQIVGRGARTFPGKFNFYLLDYGGNIYEHGEFSDPNRDWSQIFYNGIGEARPKSQKLESVNQCDGCGALYLSALAVCPNCGEKPKPKKEKIQRGENYELVPIAPMPPPSGKKIVEYAKLNNEGTSFAFKILTNQVIDLFKFYDVKPEAYARSKLTGEFDKKVGNLIRRAYFTIIRSDLQGANRKLNRVMKDIKSNLDKLYKN